MFLHTLWHQGLCKPSSCITFTLNSHWGSVATGKKKKKNKKCLVFMRTGSLRSCVTLCDPVDWPVRLLCQRGGSSRQEYWSG